MKELSISTLSHYYIQTCRYITYTRTYICSCVASHCHYNQIASSLSLKWSCSLGIDHFGQEGVEGEEGPNFWFKVQLLTSCTYMFYNLIGALKLENNPIPVGIRTSDPHFHMYEREGLGT